MGPTDHPMGPILENKPQIIRCMKKKGNIVELQDLVTRYDLNGRHAKLLEEKSVGNLYAFRMRKADLDRSFSNKHYKY